MKHLFIHLHLSSKQQSQIRMKILYNLLKLHKKIFMVLDSFRNTKETSNNTTCDIPHSPFLEKQI